MLLGIPAQVLIAQPAQKYKIEIPGKASDKPYEVIAMSQDGIALVRDLQKYDHGNKKWQVDLLDSALSRFWTTELDLDNRLELVGFEYLPGNLYLLFRETMTTYYNFTMILLKLAEKTVQTEKVKFDLNFQLTHFTVAGNTALFGGYVNSEPAVLLFNHDSDKPKVLPGLFTHNISLLDLRANHNNSFNVLLLEDRRGTGQRLTLRTFDASGNLLIDDVISVDPRYSILSGITSRLLHEDMMIMGTYGEGNDKEVLGFYAFKVDPFSEQPVTYTDLPSVAHFLDYMPEKKASSVLAKASKEKSAGRIPRFKSSLLPVRIEETGSSYYLFAEVFHPPSNVTYYPYGSPSWNYYSAGPYGSPSNPYRPSGYDPSNYQNQQRNSEVRMIQGVVLRFRSGSTSPEGVTLKYEEVRRSMLDQTGDFLVRQDSVVMAYKYKTEIFYQAEHEDPMSRPPSSKTKVELMRPADELREEDDDAGGLRFWYGRHFYTWGYRRVRGEVNNETESRYVFYVNRVDF